MGENISCLAAVSDNPALVNSAPYTDGWFFKVKLASSVDVSNLLTPEAYGAQIKG